MASEQQKQSGKFLSNDDVPVPPIKRRKAELESAPKTLSYFARAAAAKVELPFIERIVLTGWGPFQPWFNPVRVALKMETPLFARVLLLEDPDRRRVCLIGTDLHGGSRYLTEKVAALLYKQGLHAGNVFLSATHNHAGPGGIYASRYYDAFGASTAMLGGEATKLAFNITLVDEIARRIAEAVDKMTLVEARIGEGVGFMHGWSVNRSIDAFRNNFRADDAAAKKALVGADLDSAIKHGKKGKQDLERLAVDTRVKAIVALTTDATPRVIGAFATYGAHNALLSRENDVQSSDFFGKAMNLCEEQLASSSGSPNAVVALVAGSIGDSDPLATATSTLKDDIRVRNGRRIAYEDNLRLIDLHASALSAALDVAIKQARASPHTLAELKVGFLEDQIAGAPVGEGRFVATEPMVGAATLAGSELGIGSPIHKEGFPARFEWPENPQHPKRPSVLPFPAALQPPVYLRLQVKTLPLRLVRFTFEGSGPSLLLLGVPGEPTLWTCELLRRAVALRSERVLVSGVTGEYSGYFTTEKEYEAQHYEGGSTIWGRHTCRWLEIQAGRLARGEGTMQPTGEAIFSSVLETVQTRLPSAGVTGRFLFGEPD